ncbi:MAG TPA: hypothetical protein VI121_08555, partial [Agromyces sp.]
TTVDDFKVVARKPKPFVIAILAQLIVLPAVTFGLTLILPVTPSMALGMIEASGIGWQGRYEQAELIAEYLAALERAPERAGEFRRRATSEPWPDLTGGYRYLGLERMSYYVNKDAYRRAVRAATTALRGDARDAAPGRGIRSSRRRSKKVPA